MRQNRIPVITAVAGIVLALAGTLAACGSPARSSAPPSMESSSPAPSPSVAVPPDIVVVRLSTVFSPAVLRLNIGQQFLVTVSKAVQVSGLGFSGGCAAGTTAQIANGLLSARCTAGGYLYTAEHAGTTVLSAAVRPRCAAGTMCPQWITEASLKITIT
jgi:hypothetical protein